ncbi:MAG: GspH/FimT family pseudopilin [Azoarcus sp.]|nr:GspH/FimT family pseudopilin [Azoarcus sp.]
MSERHPLFATSAAAGFTLIEVMVVLSILTALATGISLSLDRVHARDSGRALETLRLGLEVAAERAWIRGQPVALERLDGGYRFLALGAGGQWAPVRDARVLGEHRLPLEVQWQAMEVEGRRLDVAQALVFAATAPSFRLTLSTPQGERHLLGTGAGKVMLVNAEGAQ